MLTMQYRFITRRDMLLTHLSFMSASHNLELQEWTLKFTVVIPRTWSNRYFEFHRSNVTILGPASFRRWLNDDNNVQEKFNLEISGGLGPTAGKVWRVGLLGFNANDANVALVIEAFRSGLKEQGKLWGNYQYLCHSFRLHRSLIAVVQERAHTRNQGVVFILKM